MSDKKAKYSFEEFKLMYESTEKVTDRRLKSNRWNYTVCLVLLLGIAGITKYSLSNPSFFYIGLASIIALSIMAILFCFLWFRQITDFKALNRAKFEVLNQMAPNVEYNPDNPGMITPFSSFEKEWKILENSEALQEKSKNKFIALKSSSMEYFIPKAFIALFIGVIFIVAVFILPNRSDYVKSPSKTSKGVVVKTQKVK